MTISWQELKMLVHFSCSYHASLVCLQATKEINYFQQICADKFQFYSKLACRVSDSDYFRLQLTKSTCWHIIDAEETNWSQVKQTKPNILNHHTAPTVKDKLQVVRPESGKFVFRYAWAFLVLIIVSIYTGSFQLPPMCVNMKSCQTLTLLFRELLVNHYEDIHTLLSMAWIDNILQEN